MDKELNSSSNELERNLLAGLILDSKVSMRLKLEVSKYFLGRFRKDVTELSRAINNVSNFRARREDVARRHQQALDESLRLSHQSLIETREFLRRIRTKNADLTQDHNRLEALQRQQEQVAGQIKELIREEVDVWSHLNEQTEAVIGLVSKESWKEGVLAAMYLSRFNTFFSIAQSVVRLSAFTLFFLVEIGAETLSRFFAESGLVLFGLSLTLDLLKDVLADKSLAYFSKS